MNTNQYSNLLFDVRSLGLTIGGSTGSEIIVGCPFHGDTHPSACFNPKSGLFFCFACGATANINQLIRKTGGEIKRVKTIVGIKSVKSYEWRPLLNSPLAIDNEYLKRRKVTNEQVERWGIRALPVGIAIPIKDGHDKEVGVIIRRQDSKPRYMFFGEKIPLWPLDWLMKQKPGSKVFVVEGVFGRLRAENAGVPAVAVMGAMVNERTAMFLKKFSPYALFDSDEAGYKGAGRLLSLVPKTRVVIPGREADELSLDEWRDIAEDVYTTGKMTDLARLSGDPRKFFSSMPHNRKSTWSV